MNDTQNILVKLTLDGTPLEGSVELPVGRAPQRMLLPALRSLTDAIVTLAENQLEGPGEKASCRKGCDACCRQMVPLAPAEVFALAAHLDGLAPAAVVPLLEKFDQAVEALAEQSLLGPLRNRHRLSAAESHALDRAYFAAHLACPFLLDRACAIHPVRPLACREYLVTSNARFCAAPGSGKVRQVALAAKPSQALLQRRREWVPLVLAREYVAQHREPHVRDPRRALRALLNRL